MTEHALPRSLYVHIPFCASKCFYCDFNSYVADHSVREAYTDHLISELTMLHQEYCTLGQRPQLDTVFFGGGTPTMMSAAQWERIAQAIHALFDVALDAEWTVEANPGSVDSALFPTLRQLGANRISFGAQTLNEGLLQAIGRLHGSADVRQSVVSARAAGFDRISVDLMLGLPDQTLADVDEAVDFVVQMGLNHVSAYGLKVEPGTPFAKWEQQGMLYLPEEDVEVAMYERMRAALQTAGLDQYEISNFARPGEEARHNLGYWRNQPYFAAGAGAHGYVFGQRYENERSLLAYEQRLQSGVRPIAAQHQVLLGEAMEDTMMLGLRLKSGVQFTAFSELHGVGMMDVFGAQIHSLVQRGWLCRDDQRVWIPAAYDEVANEIFACFVGVCT